MMERCQYLVDERTCLAEIKNATSNISIEVFPTPTIGKRIVDVFSGSNVKIKVTSSPGLEIESTLNLVEELQQNGFSPVPHIAAQQVRDENHLENIVNCLNTLNIGEIFLVKGDGDQKGKYATSTHLMKDMVTIGAQFTSIGIGGYPEGMPDMSNMQLINGIKIRQKLADALGADFQIVTQMCFDPVKIIEYSTSLKENNINVPLTIGLPNPEKADKLFATATRCKVGDSKNRLLELSPRDEYLPNDLIQQLVTTDSESAISGFHVYTFNKIKRFSDWQKSI